MHIPTSLHAGLLTSEYDYDRGNTCPDGSRSPYRQLQQFSISYVDRGSLPWLAVIDFAIAEDTRNAKQNLCAGTEFATGAVRMLVFLIAAVRDLLIVLYLWSAFPPSGNKNSQCGLGTDCETHANIVGLLECEL